MLNLESLNVRAQILSDLTKSSILQKHFNICYYPIRFWGDFVCVLVYPILEKQNFTYSFFNIVIGHLNTLEE